MPDVRRLVVLAMLAAAALVACGERPPAAQDEKPVEVSKAAVAALQEAAPKIKDAEDALAKRDWDAAIAANAKLLAALGDEPVLGGWRDMANYNTACALARSGKNAP